MPMPPGIYYIAQELYTNRIRLFFKTGHTLMEITEAAPTI